MTIQHFIRVDDERVSIILNLEARDRTALDRLARWRSSKKHPLTDTEAFREYLETALEEMIKEYSKPENLRDNEIVQAHREKHEL